MDKATITFFFQQNVLKDDDYFKFIYNSIRLKVLKMQYIGYIIDKLLRNHIYEIRVIHWISYQPLEHPGPDDNTEQFVKT